MSMESAAPEAHEEQAAAEPGVPLSAEAAEEMRLEEDAEAEMAAEADEEDLEEDEEDAEHDAEEAHAEQA